MKPSSPREALSRTAFVLALLSLATVSLRAPAWASTLALQGYYADFMLTLNGPVQTVVAGSRFATDAIVRSLGPDTAKHTTVTVRGDDDLRLLEGNGCFTVSIQSLRCELPEIAPGGQIVRRVMIDSDQDARGFRVISGLVASELLPSPNYPGLEVDAIAVQLQGDHAAGIVVANERPQIDSEHRLTWTFIVDNHGPSSLLSGRLVLQAEPGSVLTCRDFGRARCESNPNGTIYLPVDGRLEIDVTVPSIESRIGATYIAMTLYRDEGNDDGGRPSMASAAFSIDVFSDSFGD
ncbi:MAG: hypothetical protein ACT4NL_00600 [Pseudomarimonas sp.]